MAPTLLFCMLCISNYVSNQWKYRWLYGIILNTFLIFAGLALAVNTKEDKTLNTKTKTRAIIRLTDSPQQRVRSIRAKCEVVEVIQNQQVMASHEKILVYFELSDTSASKLKYGDIIAVQLSLNEFEKPINPNQFDIAKYMKQEGIRYTSFIKEKEWIFLKNNANPIINYSLKLRDKFISVFEQCSIADKQLAVLSALTLGYRELLDDEINRVYSSTGAIHILSVSGLHVGILYLFLVFILRFIPTNRLSNIIKLIIVLLFLWFFAVLTGLSPSVSRSALMFSLVAIGQWYGARSNIYNTLAAAAFALLIANPNNMLNLGFQLSFIAVLSIVVFYPFIHSLLYFKNKISAYIWSLIAVSIAAQIGTLPLTLGHFAQFPNYFILTNLIAIPLSTLILYISVLLLALSPFQIIAVWIGKLLNLLVFALNSSLEWIERLPLSISLGLHLNSFQMLILTTGLIFLASYLFSNRIRYVQISIASIILVLMLSFSHRNQIFEDEFIVFNLPKKSAICIKVKGEAHFINMDNSDKYVEQNGFYVGGYIKKNTFRGRFHSIKPNSSNPDSTILIRKSNGIAIISVKQFLVAIPYSDSTAKTHSNFKINVNAILINNHFAPNILEFIKPQVAIIDNSIPKWKLDKVMVSLVSENIVTHHLNSKGAYRQKLK